jgi:hypothetical protein
MTPPPQAPTRREKALLIALIVGSVLLWNGQFGQATVLSRILRMNDVPGILIGYRKTPHLLLDGLRWWHGSWIQDNVHVFRPISSYLLWIETAVGLRWGFLWVAWLGVFLFTLDCVLSAALAWRFTRSRFCTVLAALLAPAIRFWNWGGTHPGDWLAWYAVHHDLLMIGFLLGALLFFDVWLETARSKHLALAWICFLLGALSKEFVYVFPLMAAALALGKPRNAGVERRIALMQAGYMLATTAVLFCYRLLVLVDPYNPPPLKASHILRKPYLYWFPAYFRYLPNRNYWFPGLGLLVFALAGALVRLGHGSRRAWLSRPFAWPAILAAMVGVLALYGALACPSPATAFWFLFDEFPSRARLADFAELVFTPYSLYLLWKYRRQEPTGAAFALLILSYLPVFTYLGWHYTITGWFVRCAVYWPVIARLVWINVCAGGTGGKIGPENSVCA